MCLPHHSLFDSKTKQHKNYTIREVKDARAGLYDLVAKGKHLTPATAMPYLQAEVDKKILRDVMETVPSSGSMSFLRQNNFAGFAFDWKRLLDIERFVHNRNGPDHEFLDSELETVRRAFLESCRVLLDTLGTHTFPTGKEYSSPYRKSGKSNIRSGSVVLSKRSMRRQTLFAAGTTI